MHGAPPRDTKRLGNTLGLALAAWLAGCAQQPTRPILLDSPTPLVAGATLVAPIDRASAVWAESGDSPPPPIVLGDGQRIATSAVTLGRRRQPDAPATWLPDPGAWRPTTAAVDGSTTVLVAELPQSALGQSVWMVGRRVPAFWLLPGLGGASDAQPAAGIAATPAARARAEALVAPELADPTLRWRAELALARLGGGQADGPGPDALRADPILEAWAEQFGARWRAAHRRLLAADAELAERLSGVLTRWLVTSDAALPLWPTGGEEINDLVLAILRPGVSDEAVRRSVLAFLERQPQWISWVADDAGGIVGGSIATVNLSPQPALLSLRAPGGPWQAHGMLAPDQMAMVNVPPSAQAAGTPAVWEVRLGGRSRTLAITTDAIALQPPGMAMGPFWHDWTLEGLTTGTGRSPTPGQSGWVGGLIHKDPRLDAPPSSSSGWVVYVEVRRPPCGLGRPGQPAPDIDAVKLFFGPTGAPRAEVTVRCTGVTSFEGGGQSTEGALLTTSSDRWAFTLPIDSGWLEPDGTFLVGAQFLPHDGPRATWPRPMLPGQRAVGRVRIDPSAWSPGSPEQRRPGPVSARSPGAG